MEILGCLGTIM